ncbi:MAG: hypothetical protein K2F56_03510 [Anaeroplasmataceae bacterium]|nr:hypothetical protein [Anaeroplasmataceae bacterium]
MKKIIVLFLIILSLLGFTGCNTKQKENNGNTNDMEDDNPSITTSNILIAYFSCTNTTKTIAEYIAKDANGTLYEIVPEIPYTEADLKYYTNCRADKEQNDPSCRPAINGQVKNMESYDTIFLGYPIWHGQAPRIISTFLESYNLSNTTIIPFCTSQSSGIGSSDTNLHSLASKANWMTGRRFSSNTNEQTVLEWIKSLNLKDQIKDSNITEQPSEEITKMYIKINENKLEVALAQNSSVDALIEILKQKDIVYTADDYGGFEKVGNLGFSLPTSNSQITTEPGDVILYSGNQIVLFYGSNSWSYTQLGKIEGYSINELRNVLNAEKGSIEITLSLD